MVGADSAPSLHDSCSVRSATEPLTGTAPYARAWIAIEQPGSWGRNALGADTLPYGIGPLLAERAKDAQVGVLLIRHPQRRRHLSDTNPRQVWVAHIETNTLITLHIQDCRELLSWNLAALAAGTDIPSAPSRDQEPLALVCCHAARDACCAIHGRALYDALIAQSSSNTTSTIWQCSHLGGHRFAPTMLLLPIGAVYGRLQAPAAQEAIRAAGRGRMLLGNCRGRTHLPPAVQAADLHLRTMLQCESAGDLDYTWQTTADGRAHVTAHHRDGRTWLMTVAAQGSGLMRPASCGAEPEAAPIWDVTGR